MSLPEDRLRDVWREEIVPDVFLDARPEARPVAVLLGGQPGAGKTRAARLVTRGLYPGLRVTPIAGDDLRRFHPDYGRTLRGDRLRMPEVTAAAAGWWFQASIEHALAHRFPVLIEGTWRNVAGPLQGAGDARTAGYEVHAVVVAVAPAVSRLSTVERFYRDVGAGHDARWTPPQAHDQAVTALPASTHRLAASTGSRWLTGTGGSFMTGPGGHRSGPRRPGPRCGVRWTGCRAQNRRPRIWRWWRTWVGLIGRTRSTSRRRGRCGRGSTPATSPWSGVVWCGGSRSRARPPRLAGPRRAGRVSRRWAGPLIAGPGSG